MIKKEIGIKEAVDFLNELLEIDSAAIEALFNIRVGCNGKLADHPTVQAGIIGLNFYLVGFVGVLNGMFGIDKDGWGAIAIETEDNHIKRFYLNGRETDLWNRESAEKH